MWLIIPVVILMGMWGGQQNKIVRRGGIPLTGITMYAIGKKGKERLKGLAFGLMMIVLSMGYGENSSLRKMCGGKDWVTRIVYGLLLSIPFYINWQIGLIATLTLPISYSIRAGGFKLSDTKDFLYEDLIRFSTLGTLLWLSIK